MRWRDAYSWIALAALLVVGAAFLWHETRGTFFWVDEWNWALHRRGNDVGAFLEPHNEHLSLIPLAIYRVLLATAGLTDYAPYRALVIAAHLVCVVLVFVYASRRIGTVAALFAAALLLLLGPGWENFLWPFQIGWLISLAAGVGALLLLDRSDRVGDVGACALLALALASSGLGLPIAVGLAVDVLWGRRSLRSAWIVAAPLALYAVWWLVYQDAGLERRALVTAPGFAADSAAAALSALFGLADMSFGTGDQALEWGRPLAVAAAAALAWRLARGGPVRPRVVALLAILLSFWFATGLRRAGITDPDSSRYLYVGVLFLALLLVELARGSAPPPAARLAAAAAAAVAVLANIGDLRDGARFLRGQALPTRVELGALELGRPLLKPGFVATGMPGYPFVRETAGDYFAAAEELGSPAASAAEIAAAPEPERQLADAEFTRIHAVALRADSPRASEGTRPVVDAVSGGAATGRGHCVTFTRDGAAPAQLPGELAFTLPASGVVLSARGGQATVTVRRFADQFPEQPLARVGTGGSATLKIEGDLSDRPWHVRVAPEQRVSACGVG